MLHHKVLHID